MEANRPGQEGDHESNRSPGRGVVRFFASNFMDYADDVISPPTGNWRVPQASVAAWVIGHIATVTVFSVVLVASINGSTWWRITIALGWLGALSGLAVRVLWFLTRREPDLSDRISHRAHTTLYPVSLKWGLFFAGTYLTFLALTPIGSAMVAGFLSVVTVLSALRLAALDSWSNNLRAPLFYFSSFFSWRGLLNAVLFVGIAAATLFLMNVLVDPFLVPPEELALELFGVEAGRFDQFMSLSAPILVLGVPGLAVCELISSISRYEHAVRVQLDERLEAEAEQNANDEFSAALHDGQVMGLLGSLRRTDLSSDQRPIVDALDAHLYQLHLDRRRGREQVTVRQCLTRAFDQATSAGIRTLPTTNRPTLDLVVPPTQGQLVQRLLMLQVNNSIQAGAMQASVAVRSEGEVLTIEYSDDAGGFDPELAFDRPGGLSVIRADIVKAGGSFVLRSSGDRTLAIAELPIEETRRE